jgi:hypothetical protein
MFESPSSASTHESSILDAGLLGILTRRRKRLVNVQREIKLSKKMCLLSTTIEYDPQPGGIIVTLRIANGR